MPSYGMINRYKTLTKLDDTPFFSKVKFVKRFRRCGKHTEARKLTMPVLLTTGGEDTTTPPEDVGILFAALPWPKEFHVIENAPHTFRNPAHLSKIKRIFADWIDKLPAC